MNNKKKVALITGGSRGIGAATAVAIAKLGYDIAIVSRSAGQEALETANRVKSSGVECLSLKGDMAVPEQCHAVVIKTAETLGGVDCLIHNAGGLNPGTLLDEGLEATWYLAFDVHVHAAFHLVRSAVPFMKKRGGGAVVFVASVAGLRGITGAIPYSTVKGALYQFARSASAELSDYAIRVNTISPGITRTQFHKNMSEEQKQINLTQRIPLHKEGQPEQIAHGIAFLVSNEYITGENLTIDGGLTMRMR